MWSLPPNLSPIVDSIDTDKEISWISELSERNRETGVVELFGLLPPKVEPFQGDPNQTTTPNLVKMQDGYYYVEIRWVRLGKKPLNGPWEWHVESPRLKNLELNSSSVLKDGSIDYGNGVIGPSREDINQLLNRIPQK